MTARTPLIKTDSFVTLSVAEKICYAAGGMPYHIANTVVGFFGAIFFLEVARLSPLYISIILFGGRVLDALMDPIFGYFVNKSRKVKPWMAVSCVVASVLFFFVWFVPPGFGVEERFAYYLVTFCGYQSMVAAVYVPYTSLTMRLSSDDKQRTSATAFRTAGELVGLIIGVAVSGQIIVSFGGTSSEDCSGSRGEPSDAVKNGYMIAAGIGSFFYILCPTIVLLGTKERYVNTSHEHPSFFSELKTVFQQGIYLRLLGAYVFFTLGFAILQGNFALFCKYSMKCGKEFPFIILTSLGTAVLSIPLWHMIVSRVGKRTAYAAGMFIFCLSNTILFFAQSAWLVFVHACVSGLALATSFLLPWSMLPDVLDEVMMRTGIRKDPMFYALFVFFLKFSIGASFGISQLALYFAGYESASCSQPRSVAVTIRLFMGSGSIAMTLVALAFLWFYPIDDRYRQEITATIEAMRKNEASVNERVHQLGLQLNAGEDTPLVASEIHMDHDDTTI